MPLCPRCKRAVMSDAVSCKHCGGVLDPDGYEVERRAKQAEEAAAAAAAEAARADRARRSTLPMEAKSKNGDLLLTESMIIIKRSHLPVLSGQKLRGDRYISVSSLTSLTWFHRSPSGGYIQFAYPGCGDTVSHSLGLEAYMDAALSENGVVFDERQAEDFELIRDRLLQIMAQPRS